MHIYLLLISLILINLKIFQFLVNTLTGVKYTYIWVLLFQ